MSAAIGPGEGERLFRTGDELSRDISTGYFQHTGAAFEHIEAGGPFLDFRRRARHGHAARHFRTDCHQPVLLPPAVYRRVGEGFAFAVISDGLAEKAGADEDFGGRVSHWEIILRGARS